MILHFGPGGFSAFWYNLGIGMQCKDIREISFSGTSAGALTAWVMCFENITFEICQESALVAKKWGNCIESYVNIFASNIQKKGGKFNASRFSGVYAFNTCNLSSVKLTATNPADALLQVKRSMHIPFLTASGLTFDGYIDGVCTTPTADYYVYVPFSMTSLIPLQLHINKFSQGNCSSCVVYDCPEKTVWSLILSVSNWLSSKCTYFSKT